MALAREITTPSGKRVWRATRVLTVSKPIYDSATGEVLRLEKQKKRITGQGSTAKEAETRLEENLFQYKQKQSLNPHDPSLFAQERIAGEKGMDINGLFDAWITWRQSSECPKGKLQQSSEHEYRTRFKTHIQPILGKTKIRKVDRAMLQHFMWVTTPAKKKQAKDENGKWVDTDEPAVSAHLHNHVYTVLSMMFVFAVKERDFLRINPLENVARPNKEGVSAERKRDLVDHHYLPRRVTKALHGTPELGYWILLFIGLRTSERLGVTLSSFRNLENMDKRATLTINQQLVRDRKTGNWFLKPHTKTSAGERVLILPEFFREHLLIWKKQRTQWRKEGIKNGTWQPQEGLDQLFYVMPEGTSMRPNTDRKRWASLLKELKLPHHKLHDMRHMTASELGRLNISAGIAKLILGHSSELMSLYYTHLSSASTGEPLELIAEGLKKDLTDTIY